MENEINQLILGRICAYYLSVLSTNFAWMYADRKENDMQNVK